MAVITEFVRILISLLLVAGLTLPGCARKRVGASAAFGPGSPMSTAMAGPKPGEKLIITPETGLTGKVAKVNPAARFVVLNFPACHLPPAEQRFNVYRQGLKVGEVKVTGPQLEDNIVADLVAGGAQVGDEVRE